jgi:hypothetical protein
LGFSHEDIIDFDIGAHGPHSVSCVSAHDSIHIGAEQATGGSIATAHEIQHAIGTIAKASFAAAFLDILAANGRFPGLPRLERQINLAMGAFVGDRKKESKTRI